MGSTLISFDMVPKKNLPRNLEAEALADLRSSILVFDVPIVEECAVLRIVLGGGVDWRDICWSFGRGIQWFW